MDLAQATLYRRTAGRIGLIVGVLLLASLIDGVISRHRTAFNVVNALPGSRQEIFGPLAEKVAGVQDLTYESSAPHLTLTLENIFTGHWFGDDMWRGWLTVGPPTPPGKYTLTVKLRQPQSAAPPVVFRVNVYADVAALNKNALSLVQRYTGWSPWWLAAGTLPVLLAMGLTVFWLSGKIDRLLAQAGRAEVYRVTRRESGFDLNFGLGSQHGVKPGDRLDLFDPSGQHVGAVAVTEVSEAVGVAWAEVSEVRPGFFVQKEKT